MKRSITVRNLKNIGDLEFNIPGPGLHLLVGVNGAGKTTLLTCLHRIGHSNAFRENFAPSSFSTTTDQYKGAHVIYTVGDEQVTYSYKAYSSRWNPSPKSKAKLLKKFGYGSVLFIKADRGRIEPTQKELKDGTIRKVKPELVKALNDVFETSKYNELRRLRIERGRSREIILLPVKTKPGTRSTFFSEKNFSLGEITVIKLLREIHSAGENSLILVDETELALHPRVQVHLLRHLGLLAKNKKLTIILSTHSVSMIGGARKENIHLLQAHDNASGKVEAMTPCYPAFAVGTIAFDTEVIPDFIFYVEDEKARLLLDQMIACYLDVAYKTKLKPTYKIARMGGDFEVITFLTDTSDYLFPSSAQTHAWLDADSEPKIDALCNIPEGERRPAEKRIVDRYLQGKARIHFLPCIPEEGVIDLLESDISANSAKLKDRGAGCAVADIMAEPDYKKPDQHFKKKFAYLVKISAGRSKQTIEHMERLFFFHYVHERYNNTTELHKLFGPIF